MRLGKICELLRLSSDTDQVSKHVRSWHIADVQTALTNVCFEGKNGHDAGAIPCPLMTQSGHFEPGRTHSRSIFGHCQKK